MRRFRAGLRGYRFGVNSAEVGCRLVFDVTSPAEIVLQIAAAGASSESLTATCDGRPLAVSDDFRAPVGRVVVSYQAHVSTPPPPAPIGRIEALRPSRYCPSDRLGGFAARMFGGADDPVRAIVDWVNRHLIYQAGASGPSTDAIDTLLSGQGVCRDYAHLTATLCRSLDIPARVAAVYAPGLSPMDFHLVTETLLDGEWRVWDATRLAPRPTLVRIATGRDAADTAFATTITGALTLPELEIFAVAADDLPYDDHQALVSLP